jgi:4-amino-4-deoxy-L-arabinose transferase-like glycosyltransferase
MMQSEKTLIPGIAYPFLFFLLGMVYISGLFVPLMDNDSAHHAIIALRMHLTGDYVNLYDYSQDYLDKPHLHFWLSALSYKIFGVNSFAYKFPSFLFTIMGTWSVYRLGRRLYNQEVGKLAALLIASAFGYMLANNDVRMDAILTACIAFATWQLVEFADTRRMANVAGSAIGLGLGFCTKGHIAVFVPAVAILFYILFKRDWKLFLNWKWLVMLFLFALVISPVVYCYYLQYNLHPEKTVRGKDHINGVLFILFNQSVERFGGEMGDVGKSDRLFFIHSFAWAFAPWSIITFIAFVRRIRRIASRRDEWLTPAVFGTMLLLISLSDFKLPHYLNVTFPAVSVMAASFIMEKKDSPQWMSVIFSLQLVICFLLLILAGIINAWLFPVHSAWVIVGTIALLATCFYFLMSRYHTKIQKAIAIPVSAMALLFFLLNTNFYPKLLSYQGGNVLASAIEDKVNPDKIYFEENSYSPSFNFYTSMLRRPLSDSVLLQKDKCWVFVEEKFMDSFSQKELQFHRQFEVPRFRVTQLNSRFLDPSTRPAQLSRLYLIEVSRKQQ